MTEAALKTPVRTVVATTTGGETWLGTAHWIVKHRPPAPTSRSVDQLVAMDYSTPLNPVKVTPPTLRNGTTVRVYTRPDGAAVYLNIAYLGQVEELCAVTEWRQTADALGPVAAFSGDELVGVVMPVRMG